MAASLIIVSVLIIYFVTIVIKLGLHQRIPLAFGKISIEKISDRAARKYGDKILFTSDYPCSWDISILKDQYPDQFAWSAKRIKVVSGYLAKMLQEYFQIQKKAEMIYIPNIQFKFFLPGDSIPSINLGPSGNTRPYIVAPALFFCI